MSAAASPILAVDGLSVALGGRSIVEAASLRLARGERVGLSGPSGAGKSTLLRAIAQLIPCTSGRVTLDDRAPDDADIPAFRADVVYVPQRPLMVRGSVERNLRLALDHAAVRATASWNDAQVRGWLEALDLPTRLLGLSAEKLSVGQRQRVSLVRALVVEPRVLLLDEPTSGLDDDASDQVIQVLRQVSDEGGVAIAIASHRTAQLDALCHRVVDLEPRLRGHLA